MAYFTLYSSRPAHVATRVRIPFLSKAEYYPVAWVGHILLSIHLSVGILGAFISLTVVNSTAANMRALRVFKHGCSYCFMEAGLEEGKGQPARKLLRWPTGDTMVAQIKEYHRDGSSGWIQGGRKIDRTW